MRVVFLDQAERMAAVHQDGDEDERADEKREDEGPRALRACLAARGDARVLDLDGARQLAHACPFEPRRAEALVGDDARQAPLHDVAREQVAGAPRVELRGAAVEHFGRDAEEGVELVVEDAPAQFPLQLLERAAARSGASTAKLVSNSSRRRPRGGASLIRRRRGRRAPSASLSGA